MRFTKDSLNEILVYSMINNIGQVGYVFNSVSLFQIY